MKNILLNPTSIVEPCQESIGELAIIVRVNGFYYTDMNGSSSEFPLPKGKVTLTTKEFNMLVKGMRRLLMSE